jgi:hypothetical protein
MKKHLLIIAAIFVIAIIFGGTTYAQFGNILNKAKDAIEKKKDKKKEPTPTTTTTTESNETSSDDEDSTSKPSSIDETRLRIYLDDIIQAEKDVDNFVNGDGKLLVYVYGDSNILEKAISPKARAEYLLNRGGATQDPQGKLNAELDKLAKMIDAPMRKYLPNDDNFQYKTPADIKLMKDLLSSEKLTIFKIGVFSANWNIAKDEYGLPQNRFKFGYVYAKDNGSDQPYCIRYELKIIQDYAGGGTYGASFAWKDYDHQAIMVMGCPVATPKTSPKTKK